MNRSESVQLLDYLRAVRRRWWLIALTALVATAAALAVSLSGDKQYDATAELLLRDEEPINAILQPDAVRGYDDPERDLNTNVELITTGAVAHAARRRLGIQRSTDDLVDQVETDTSDTSNIVRLRVRDRVPQLAADIANAFATAYISERLQYARARYDQAARLATAQLESLAPAERESPQGQELEARRRELQIAAALQTGGSQIVRRASVPSDPSRPRPKLSGALGLALGLLLGVGIVLTLELVDRRLKDEEAIEDFTELPILVGIPRPSRRAGRPADHAQSEAYGLLAANLRFATLHRETNVLMVTSPSPGEGKTSVTLGTARALTRLGLRVIAIEADLRRPTFRKQAALPPTAGLAGVLARSSELADELLWLDAGTLALAAGAAQASGPAFAMLPAGDLPPDPQRALANPAMGDVVRSARRLADVVIIDTAPIGTVNDPAALSPFVDSIALVVRLNGTSRDAARRAMRVLRSLDVSLAGVVVTGAGDSAAYGYYPATRPERESVAVDDPRG